MPERDEEREVPSPSDVLRMQEKLRASIRESRALLERTRKMLELLRSRQHVEPQASRNGPLQPQDLEDS